MGKESGIEWTDHTFNVVWGCEKVSPACDHCYAEAWAKRAGFGWGRDAPRRTFGDKHWAAPLAWHRDAVRAGRRARVFCSSMADVFEDHPVVAAERLRLWPLIEATPMLDWLLLTKRPRGIRECLPADWIETPPPNLWLGTTVELQEYAEPRLQALLSNRAVVHFVSCEPLLGPLDLGRYLCRMTADSGQDRAGGPRWSHEIARIDWVIVGGESGGGARPFHIEAARSLRDQCRQHDTACFVKQLGARPVLPTGLLPLRHKKGADAEEWPQDLRVKQFPTPRTVAA